MQTNNYDVIVVGAGSGGLTTAVGLSKVGKKVLLVEKEHFGGECTNSGCIPSKALLHQAKHYWSAQKIAGTTPQSETFRQAAFTSVRAKIAEVLADETEEHFVSLGITVAKGEAVFESKNSLTVNGESFHFKKAVIATGSNPRPLAVPGLDEADILTNQNFFALEAVPAHTLIIGAGPIGMELGQALAMLGSKVTIINNRPEFASLEDTALRPYILSAFAELGITILNNAAVKQVTGKIAEVEVKSPTDETTHLMSVPFDTVLVAIGRVPNIPPGLTLAGVEATAQGITVDTNWRTTNKRIYALGDVAAILKFTHVADDTARQVTAHIVSKGLLRVQQKAVPKVTYTEPEIAQVGLSWNEASTTYGETKIVRIEVPLTENDRARTDDATAGVLIVIAKRLTGTVLGAHMVGPRAGEIIATFTLAIEQNISLFKLRSLIFPYPTYSLLIKKAGDKFLATQVANLKQDLWQAFVSNAPKVLAGLIWVAALVWLYTYKIESGQTFTDIAVLIFTFITSTMWGPLLYILAYTIRPLTFFPGTALTILSGVFFGLPGILYTIIGANLSATLAYLVGRFFSTKGNNKGILSGSIELLRQHPFMTILTMRLSFFPFDIVNYGAGLLRVPFVPFLLATIIGTLLGIATFVAIGASLSVEEFIKNGLTIEAIDSTFIMLSVAIFIASHVAARLVKNPTAA